MEEHGQRNRALKTNLGKKGSALLQASGYCASQLARVQHAEKITMLDVGTHSAFERSPCAVGFPSSLGEPCNHGLRLASLSGYPALLGGLLTAGGPVARGPSGPSAAMGETYLASRKPGAADCAVYNGAPINCAPYVHGAPFNGAPYI